MASNSNAPPAKPRGALSLYANLLNPDAASSSAGTISRAPVVFAPGTTKDDDAATAQKQLNAGRQTLNPIPQPAQKGKLKSGFTQVPSSNIDIPCSSSDPVVKAPTQVPAVKSTLADWTGGDDDDINDFYTAEKRQRGGRRKRRKDKEERVVVQNWDDIYDPSRPNVYEDYKNSEEKYREIREWKDRLYAHRLVKRKQDSDYSEDSDYERPRMNSNFAPPPTYSFAPPSFDADENDDKNIEPPIQSITALPPPPPAEVPNDTTGEDAYARRLRLSQQTSGALPQPPPAPPAPPSPSKARLPTPPPVGSIARAPVRYQLPPAPSELPTSEAELETALMQEEQDPEPEADVDIQRSTRPGQKGFAERLMSKYGWTKGSGLGASGSGIVNPLRVQVDKRKKKSDAEGGGFVGPAAKGRIIGAKQKPAEPTEEGPFGAMSEVIILRGMVDGLDLDTEMGEGGLMQEIGEECAEKYGRVERVFIHRQHSDPTTSVPVFIKFTSPLSALRAVNALEGRVFNGNTIRARFYNAETFEAGIYE